MFDSDPEEIFEINIMQDLKFLHFPLADIFVKAPATWPKAASLMK
jgi:hypothetical protein